MENEKFQLRTYHVDFIIATQRNKQTEGCATKKGKGKSARKGRIKISSDQIMELILSKVLNFSKGLDRVENKKVC